MDSKNALSRQGFRYLSLLPLLSVLTVPIAGHGQPQIAVAAPERFGVINVIPNNQSYESHQNAEPSLAVGTGSFYNDFAVHAFQPSFWNTNYTSVNGGSVWNFADTINDADLTSDWSASGTYYAAYLFYPRRRV